MLTKALVCKSESLMNHSGLGCFYMAHIKNISCSTDHKEQYHVAMSFL